MGWGLNKVRFGFVGLFLRLTENWQSLEKVTADSWLRKYAGRDVYKRMWEPLLVGKFGPYYKEVNMAWFWARLHARTTKLGTYKGGFQAFADDFTKKLRADGVEIILNTPVRRIEIVDNGMFEIHTETDSGCGPYDKVLSTTSPGLMAKLSPDLPPDYLDGLLSLKSMGAVVMTLSLKEQLSKEGFYWFNIPKDAGYPFLAVVEHTNYVSQDNFGGDHILYCGDYLEQNHEYFELGDEELLFRFIPEFKR